METATIVSITIAVIVILITIYAIYISFGPPSTQLSDPFEDHED